MRALLWLLAILSFTFYAAPRAEAEVSVDLLNLKPGALDVKQQDETLHLTWSVGKSQVGRLILNLAAQKPLIAELSVSSRADDRLEATLLKDVSPVYYLTVGQRDLKPQGWSVFFDNPPRRPHQTFPVVLATKVVRAQNSLARGTIILEGLTAGPFQGELQITVYRDSPLVHLQAVLSTQQDACAILYDAGLSSEEPSWESVAWLDTSDRLQRSKVGDRAAAQPLAVRQRTIVAESEQGSVAVFPPPHQFLYPLDFADNFQFAWQGQGYRDSGKAMGLGVRQPPEGDKRYVPWVNAPPGTKQSLSLFLHLSRQKGEEAIAEVGKFTHGDRFAPLPGYRTFTSHYHIEHTLDYLAKQRQQQTTGIPQGLEEPPFIKTFQDRGVEIVHLAEFHVNHSPEFIQQRIPQLAKMHEECRRLSNDKFLLLPGEEPNVHLGGHWISFFPKPVYWQLHPTKEMPFEKEVEGLGTVYSVHNADEVLKLMEKEGGLMWTAHARTKSSFGFPDKYRDQPFYKSDRFLGAAWKAMPADYSRPRLGWRVLDLFDDMANWGQPKYVLGEVDVFRVQPDYELYGHMNINYLKLDKLPKFDDGWQPVVDALRNGQFFVSTGEVLIPEFTVNGKQSGEKLQRAGDGQVEIAAQLNWTFPPSFAEVVWGDGEKVYREKIDLTAHGAFGETEVREKLALKNAKWARLEAWDVAANGAFTQPVWIE